MGVRPGLKQTDLGVIPNDWLVKPIRDLKPFVTSGSRGWAAFYSDHGSPFLRITNLSRTCIYPDLSDLRFVALGAGETEAARTQVRRGDVLISVTADIGVIGYVSSAVPLPAYVNQHIALIRFDATSTSSLFVAYFLASETPQRLFRALTDSGAKAGMNLATVQQVRLALPPTLVEQESIANALSDADALIESLEQLLAKKRHLKQGAMQELLTGKKRLPGFSEKWVVARLEELGRWVGGMTPSMANRDYWQGGTVPWISSADVKTVRLTATASSITDFAVKQRATTRLPARSVVVVTRSGILRKYLPVAMNMVPMAINQDIKALIPNGLIQPDYLLHMFTHYGDLILARCLKSGTTVESIEFRWLKAFTVPVPSLPEQTAVADMLSEMDAEIDALEAKLAKARRIKQGMMQELLTGRIRLV